MDPTTPNLEAPATFTAADRALLIAVAEKLNQPVPSDLREPSALATSVDPLGAAPAFDPGPVAFDTTGPIVLPSTPAVVQVSNPPDVATTSPTNPAAPPAPTYEPAANSPALAGLPMPAAAPVSRGDDCKFTEGQRADLAAIVALIREKFPHALPDEIPATR